MKVKLGILMILPGGNNKRKKTKQLCSVVLTVDSEASK